MRVRRACANGRGLFTAYDPTPRRQVHYGQIRITGSFGVGPYHVAQALRLLTSGQVDFAPIVTTTFPFEETPEAIAYAMNQVGLKTVVVFET